MTDSRTADKPISILVNVAPGRVYTDLIDLADNMPECCPSWANRVRRSPTDVIRVEEIYVEARRNQPERTRLILIDLLNMTVQVGDETPKPVVVQRYNEVLSSILNRHQVDPFDYDGYLDASAYDEILQHICFGEQVYG